MNDMSDTPTCFRKRLFASYEEAEKAAKRLPVRMRIYRCPTCRAYHLTSRVIPKKIERRYK